MTRQSRPSDAVTLSLPCLPNRWWTGKSGGQFPPERVHIALCDSIWSTSFENIVQLHIVPWLGHFANLLELAAVGHHERRRSPTLSVQTYNTPSDPHLRFSCPLPCPGAHTFSACVNHHLAGATKHRAKPGSSENFVISQASAAPHRRAKTVPRQRCEQPQKCQ